MRPLTLIVRQGGLIAGKEMNASVIVRMGRLIQVGRGDIGAALAEGNGDDLFKLTISRTSLAAFPYRGAHYNPGAEFLLMVIAAGTVTRKLHDCFVGCSSSAVVTFGDVHVCTRVALNLQHIYDIGRVSG